MEFKVGGPDVFLPTVSHRLSPTSIKPSGSLPILASPSIRRPQTGPPLSHLQSSPLLPSVKTIENRWRAVFKEKKLQTETHQKDQLDKLVNDFFKLSVFHRMFFYRNLPIYDPFFSLQGFFILIKAILLVFNSLQQQAFDVLYPSIAHNRLNIISCCLQHNKTSIIYVGIYKL